ncbi:DegV family protein [Solibacillus silvestris]|uniref:DegV family protein n=1 Tax=Solibacillus silvestris TaxID=76853 RepID=UPI003F7D3F0F
MERIVFSTESSSDLPKHLAEKYGIYVAPMHVVLDSVPYLDSEVSIHETLDYYERTKMIPATSATSLQEYEAFFSSIQEKHPNGIIIHFGNASNLTESFQNAQMIAKKFSNIYLIDTKNIAIGLTALVIFAAKTLEEDPFIDIPSLLEKIQSIISKVKVHCITKEIDFLKAGGKVNNTYDIENIPKNSWPSVKIDSGKLELVKHYKGELQHVMESFLTDYFAEFELCKEQIYLTYSLGFSGKVKQYIHRFIEKMGYRDIVWIEAGTLVSIHIGPGGLGIAGIER